MTLKIIENIRNYRSIIFTLSILDLKLRYRSSILGIFWSFLEPLLILTILFIVFSSILKNDIVNFPIFLLLGIILFQLYSRVTAMGMESILIRSGVVSSVNIPKVIFPIAASLTALYMMIFEFVVFFMFMVFFQYLPPLTILFLPVVIFLVFVLSLGIAIPFSVLNVHYRDIRSIWTIILQATFFMTPIFYKLEFLPQEIKQFLQYSPLVQLVEMSHLVVLENRLPDPFWLFYTVVSVVVIFLAGLLIYKKFSKNVVERL